MRIRERGEERRDFSMFGCGVKRKKKREGGRTGGGYLYDPRVESDGGKQGGWGYASPHGRRSE